MTEPFAPSVIAIFGPTASGKTAVAEAIAERIPAEVVSADAMQVYRGLPILTNQSGNQARLVGIWPLSHDGSVAEYAALAHAAIDEILETGRTPIVAGGTGLYLRAALADLDVPPPPKPDARERWERLYDRLGAQQAHDALERCDPKAAAQIHAHDRRRVVRALELAERGASLRGDEDRLWGTSFRRATVVFGLDVPKDVLERRIAERTRVMFERGVEREVAAALAEGVSRTAAVAFGLREIDALPSEEAFEALIVRTRRYAAYQRKWMRRIPGLVVVDADRSSEEVASDILTRTKSSTAVPQR